ncbi:PTS glucose beta-glucoside transporter subunit IIBC [Candidatus Hepatincolaceae symbiont of Richtersius coronifer]
MVDYKTLAAEIIHKIGKDNIVSLTHCVTRLRFILKDKEKVNKNEIKMLKGVLGVLEGGGQFQVVVGMEVPYIYEEVLKQLAQSNKEDSSNANFSSAEQLNNAHKRKFNPLTMILDFMSGSFLPILPALVGAGLLKGLVVAATSLGILSVESGEYYILNAASNAFFYFMPILLGFSAAKKVGANPFVGAIIAAALLEPNYTNLLDGKVEGLTFLTIPIVLNNYASSVVPIIFAVIILGYLERFMNKITHKTIQLFIVPMVSIAVIVPLTILAFGPFAMFLTEIVGASYNFLHNTSPIITGMVLGAGWFVLVIFGLHWAFIPIFIANYQLFGYDNISPLSSGSALYAQIGAALGVYLKTKDPEVKAIAGPAFFTGLLTGITEPIIYGVIIRHRKTIIATIIGGALCGGIIGTLNIKLLVGSMGGIFGLPIYFTANNFLLYLLVSISTIFFTAGLAILIGFKDNTKDKIGLR